MSPDSIQFARQCLPLRLPGLIACLAFSACAPVAGRGGFVPLAPIDGLLAQAKVTAIDPGPALAVQAARLRTRAAALRP